MYVFVNESFATETPPHLKKCCCIDTIFKIACAKLYSSTPGNCTVCTRQSKSGVESDSVINGSSKILSAFIRTI